MSGVCRCSSGIELHPRTPYLIADGIITLGKENIVMMVLALGNMMSDITKKIYWSERRQDERK